MAGRRHQQHVRTERSARSEQCHHQRRHNHHNHPQPPKTNPYPASGAQKRHHTSNAQPIGCIPALPSLSLSPTLSPILLSTPRVNFVLTHSLTDSHIYSPTHPPTYCSCCRAPCRHWCRGCCRCGRCLTAAVAVVVAGRPG